MDIPYLETVAKDPLIQSACLTFTGVLATHGLLRRFPAQRLFLQFGFFLALTALLHYYDITPYKLTPTQTPTLDRVFVDLTKVVWWINAAWFSVGCARLFLFFEKRPRESRLLQDLVVGVIYLAAILSVAVFVFDAPLGTLVATSGVLAIILGLALQSTLSDVFSGIALNVSRAYAVGDWLVLSGSIEGRVVETNWRATHLLNSSNDLVVLPNSTLAKAQLTNVSSPNRNHGVSLRFRVSPTQPPSALVSVMRNVLLSSSTILHVPSPTVEIRSMDAQAVELELSFSIANFEESAAVELEIYNLVYRHTRAAGLTLAYPAQSAISTSVGAGSARPATLQLLDNISAFSLLTEQERATLAAAMVLQVYRKGDVIASNAGALKSLLIMRYGVAVISHVVDGRDVEATRFSAGECAGESGSLFSHSIEGTIRALTYCEAYTIEGALLQKLVAARPPLAEQLHEALSRPTETHPMKTDDMAAPAMPALGILSRLRRLVATSSRTGAPLIGSLPPTIQ